MAKQKVNQHLMLLTITSSVPSSLHACSLKPSNETMGMTLPSLRESQAQWGNTTLPYPSICLTEFRYCKTNKQTYMLIIALSEI